MSSSVYAYIFVAAGGALGAIARYGLHNGLQSEQSYPWGTLAANLLGCFAMGMVAALVANAAWFSAGNVIPEQHRLLFAVGFCGSFTTLSAMVLEINVLMQRDDLLTAFAYLTVTLLGGFACFWIGARLVRLIYQSNALN